VYDFPSSNPANNLEVSSTIDQNLSNQCLNTFINLSHSGHKLSRPFIVKEFAAPLVEEKYFNNDLITY